jgi:hypothetical protein
MLDGDRATMPQVTAVDDQFDTHRLLRIRYHPRMSLTTKDC